VRLSLIIFWGTGGGPKKGGEEGTIGKGVLLRLSNERNKKGKREERFQTDHVGLECARTKARGPLPDVVIRRSALK